MIPQTRNILISTLYKVDPVLVCLTKLQIDKVVLLVDDPIVDTQKESLEKIKSTFQPTIEIVEKNIAVYEILSIAKDVIKLIDSLGSEFGIIVNVSGGRKPQALGVLYATGQRANRIRRLVYVKEDNNEIIDLPIIYHGLSSPKVKILEYLKQNKPISEISTDLDKTKSMIYNHIRGLKAHGFITEGNQLTLAGKLAIL